MSARPAIRQSAAPRCRARAPAATCQHSSYMVIESLGHDNGLSGKRQDGWAVKCLRLACQQNAGIIRHTQLVSNVRWTAAELRRARQA